MKKKLLAIIATVAMVVTMIPSMVFADGANVAQIGSQGYTSLQAAIYAAKDGETVKLLENINADFSTMNTANSSDLQPVLFKIEGNKAIKLDMNGKTITADFSKDTSNKIYAAVIYIAPESSLEVGGNGAIKAINVVKDNKIKLDNMFWKHSTSDLDEGNTTSLIINNGNYNAKDLGNAVVYTNNDEIVTINGGNFSVDTTGQRKNGHPWIFGAKYQDANRIIVNGGTFNADVNHQYWEYEVYVDKTKALKNNGDGTWTVVDAAAYVDEYHSWYHGAYTREVGYATLEEAVEAVNKPEEEHKQITLLKDCQISDTLHFEGDKDFIINLNDKKLIWKGNDNTPIVSFDNGATLNKDSKNLDPSKEGYTFKGWYTDANYESEWNWDFESIGSQTRATQEVINLYAKWEEDPVEPTIPGGEAAPDDTAVPEEPADEVDTGDDMNMAIPFGIAGLTLAAMAAVVATRRRAN